MKLLFFFISLAAFLPLYPVISSPVPRDIFARVPRYLCLCTAMSLPVSGEAAKYILSPFLLLLFSLGILREHLKKRTSILCKRLAKLL